MRNRHVKFGVLAFGLALLSGCSSCSDAGPGNTNVENSNTVNVVTPERVENGNSAQGNTNGNLVPYPGLENGKNPTLDESKVKVIDMSKVKASAPPPLRMPDNSEISTVQSPDGKAFIETRKFNDHPQILKLERTSKSGNDRIVKVYLKNGKVITVDNAKLKDFARDTASSILLAAGQKPEPPRVSDPDSKKQQSTKEKPGAN